MLTVQVEVKWKPATPPSHEREAKRLAPGNQAQGREAKLTYGLGPRQASLRSSVQTPGANRDHAVTPDDAATRTNKRGLQHSTTLPRDTACSNQCLWQGRSPSSFSAHTTLPQRPHVPDPTRMSSQISRSSPPPASPPSIAPTICVTLSIGQVLTAPAAFIHTDPGLSTASLPYTSPPFSSSGFQLCSS
jgi:hypothetical protein